MYSRSDRVRLVEGLVIFRDGVSDASVVVVDGSVQGSNGQYMPLLLSLLDNSGEIRGWSLTHCVPVDLGAQEELLVVDIPEYCPLVAEELEIARVSARGRFCFG